MSAAATIAAAAFAGVVASTHCIAMCGGISGALGMASARGADGRPRRDLLVAYQAGRIASYALAGLVVGAIGDGVIRVLDADRVRIGLRLATAAAIAATALSLLLRTRAPGLALGLRAWPRLSRLGRGLLPVTNPLRAFAFGTIWGWMPCGLAYSMLLVAALAGSALDASATMLAFGLGTAPAMLATAWGWSRIARAMARSEVRHAAGLALLACGVLVAIGPWLAPYLPGHAWLPFDCVARHR
ncbi:MAG TPA: sulfite exporter TauE/SafE family protein [Dokdonella sp.]|nr:sulfite exporter TauE/SafE family protein [Dokdonella sp.]